MRPKSSSSTFIWRKSIALTVPSVIGTSYVWPVRLSVTVRVSVASATPPPPLALCSSVAIVLPRVRKVGPVLPALSASGTPGALRLSARRHGCGHRAEHEQRGHGHDALRGALAGEVVVAHGAEDPDQEAERGEQAASD